jgi:heat shock protein HtpX
MWEIIRANRRKSALLVGLLGSVLVILGGAIGYYFLPADPLGILYGCLVALVIWVILLLASITSGEQILLATAGARQVNHNDAPQLYNVVEEMKIASGLPAMPKVYIMDSHVPNAFAVGLKPERAAVAVTSGLLSKLNRDELQGVIAHEIGHIANRDTLFMTMAGVTVGAVVIMSDLFLRGLWFSGGGNRRRSSKSGGGQLEIIIFAATILLAILAPLISQLIYLATSRKREYLADASAAQFTRYPEGLASALEKISDNQEKKFSKSRTLAPMFIVNPMAAWEGSSGLFSTHPPTAERVRILRRMTRGSSFQAYEQAYRKIFPEGLMAPATLRMAEEKGIRKTDEKSKRAHDPQKNLRQVKDILHKMEGYGIIACACGVKLKIPPKFKYAKVGCPKCKRSHDVSVALLAASMAAGLTENKKS